MTEPGRLTVPTAFVDISQLSEGLADRVDEERIMLYGPSAVEDGSWVRFAVTLADASIALEGVGRAVASIDGGEERPDVARFDIVLDSLQLEGSSEVVYERILMVRSQAFAESPSTGEVSLDDVDQLEQQAADFHEGGAHAAGAAQVAAGFADEPTAVAGDDYQAEAVADYHQPADLDMDDSTVVGEVPDDPPMLDLSAPDGGDVTAPGESADAAWADDGGVTSLPTDAPPPFDAASGHEDASEYELADYEEASRPPPAAAPYSRPLPPSAPPPAPPSEPGGFRIAPLGTDGRVLHRPSRSETWTPEIVPGADPTPSSGYFVYSGGVPIPDRLPRPDLDPSLRIAPAPRPADGENGAGEASVRYAVPGDVTATDQESPSTGEYEAVEDVLTDPPPFEAAPAEYEGETSEATFGDAETSDLDFEEQDDT